MGPRPEALLGVSWPGCVRGVPEPGPQPGAHTSGHGLFLAALDARLGVPTPCFHWEFPALRAADGRGSSAGGAREPQRHTRGHPVLVACAPAEPGHGLGRFPTTPRSLPADWGWKRVDTHLPHLLYLAPSQSFWTTNLTVGHVDADPPQLHASTPSSETWPCRVSTAL